METKGQLESAISEKVTSFEKEYMGRGPTETKTFIIEDMVVVRLKGVLTPGEQQLAEGSGLDRGRQLLKQVRMELVERARPLLEAMVKGVTRRNVISLHTDISTTLGERVIIFVLDGRPECSDR